MVAARRPGLVLACCVVLLGGCSFGPAVIRLNMLRYNRAMNDTENEQFLLNIVRLRYRDPPKTLAVGSINTSFNVDATFPSVFSLKNHSFLAAQGRIADVPTISMTPLGGQDFTTGLVSQIPLERIVVLVNTGWDLDRALRLLVSNMNGVENVPNLAGGAAERPPRFVQFAYVARALGRLHREGLLELAVDPMPAAAGAISDPVTIDKGGVTVAMAMTAAKDHFIIREVGPGKAVVHNAVPAHDMNLAPAAWKDPELAESAQLLNLIPGLPTYRLLPADLGQFKRQYEGPGHDITVTTRSCLSTMLFISKGVVVPAEHYRQGLVAIPTDDEGRPFDWTQVTEGMFRVCVSKIMPKRAFVKVKYRGYWFYIADNDLASKSTFDLVAEMLQIQITRGLTTAPVLTIPVSAGGGGGGGGGGAGGGGKKGR